ncbi:hypothetical protein BMWSH_4422 [Priestia megaterium WSH-002]|uniref:Uncharacterized protein n=1 Tax=Priestia megaterium (strain WSH-002) TaxID=1006007 RepID=A0A8D3X2M9_PRIMW|nr:hypothetical protein [Priestia megaterium]AEN91300.1 hypothetical protein BMWSH_4422 [Priestia megaterium WSH-002]
MKLALLLVIIIGVAALAGTISAAKKVDEDYGKSKKKSIVNLSIIYGVVFIGSIVGVAWYIVVRP